MIQAVALGEFEGLSVPNAEGEIPLHDLDPTRPNPKYFEHVDWIVRRAGELGLTIGMLPTWGDKWNLKWGPGPEIFTPHNARAYGEWLGRRYREASIIWILGGDRPIEAPLHRDITDSMAWGLKDGDGGRHLMTFHPNGQRTSSEWLHGAPWLDFNMWQTGHARGRDNYASIAHDHALSPPKPCLDAEPGYEDHNSRWNGQPIRLDDLDVRKSAFWALFSGACGHTYGSIDVCLFWQPGVPTFHGGSNLPWREALQLRGAAQMRHARALLESRPFFSRVPDQSLVASAQSQDAANTVVATRGEDGSYALIYIPHGAPIEVNLARLSGEQVRAHWFNPRSGQAHFIGELAAGQPRRFEPPPGGPDWILALDDASRDFPAPGQA